MWLTLPVLILLFFSSAGFVSAVWIMAPRFAPEPTRKDYFRRLLVWTIKGLLAPVTLWALMNLGLSWNLQPFMPKIQAAQNSGGNWFPEFFAVLTAGLFIISSYWAALTLGWALVLAGAGLEGEARSDFKALCWTSLLGMLVPALGLVLLGGWGMAGVAAAAMLVPIAGYGPAIVRPKQLPPMYARAIAKMKFGKYTEAEWEIIRELEKCEDDFEGWMMMAELYANHFNDLAEAEQTILEICEQPRTTPSQLSIALHRLADWQLKLAADPEAARRALQMISDRLPGTHLARMALLRLHQLPGTSQELREQRTPYTIPLPALSDAMDDEPAPSPSSADKAKAAEQAKMCAEKLARDPNDVPTREKLARLLAEPLGQPDAGLAQLKLLLDLPDQPEGRKAEWLGLSAAWHIKYRRDAEAGRKALMRIIQEFPDTPQAFAARRRLTLLEDGSESRL